jgi:hypothetical protein
MVLAGPALNLQLINYGINFTTKSGKVADSDYLAVLSLYNERSNRLSCGSWESINGSG